MDLFSCWFCSGLKPASTYLLTSTGSAYFHTDQIRSDLTISFLAKSELSNSKRSPLQVRAPVRERRAEVAVSNMCEVFVVQVRCMHVNSTGYWSEWSRSVDSAPQNSRGTVYLSE